MEKRVERKRKIKRKRKKEEREGENVPPNDKNKKKTEHRIFLSLGILWDSVVVVVCIWDEVGSGGSDGRCCRRRRR